MKTLQCSAMVLACFASVPTQSSAELAIVSDCAKLNQQIYPNSVSEFFLDAGDTLAFSTVSGLPVIVQVYIPTTKEPIYVTLPSTYTAVTGGPHAVVSYGKIAVVNTIAVNVSPVIVSMTCTPAGSGGTGTGQSNANAQSSNIMAGIGMAGAMREGGAQASKTNLFAGVEGDGGAFVWGHVDYSSFSGDAEGDSLGLTFGIDRTYGDVRYGLVLSNETSELDGDTVRSLAFGPYVSGSAGGLDVDAYVALARVEYDATALVGERVQYGLRATGEVVTAFATLRPTAQVTGYSEDLDGDTNTATQLSLGSRIEFAETAGGFMPYLNLAYEANRSTTAGVTSEFSAPRVGLGVRNQMGAGTLTFDLDFGSVADGIKDVGVGLSYSQSF